MEVLVENKKKELHHHRNQWLLPKKMKFTKIFLLRHSKVTVFTQVLKQTVWLSNLSNLSNIQSLPIWKNWPCPSLNTILGTFS